MYKINQTYPFLGVSFVDILIAFIIIVLFATKLATLPGNKIVEENADKSEILDTFSEIR